jgi:hypothetical protein
MKRLIRVLFAAGASRAVPPVIIGLFFLLYIGIAFFTDETLITLMAFTGKFSILAGLLALIPLNCALRILLETGRHRALRRALSGKSGEGLSDLFDESVELPNASPFAELESRLSAEGYTTLRSEKTLAAWRGFSIYPVRLLFLAGFFSLFAGILISVTTRTSSRQMVIEGDALPTPDGSGGTVERIILARSSGPILSRELTMQVAAGPGESGRSFGLYPPSLYKGAFVYPRYLGLALSLRFSAPDLPAGYETRSFLNCYPPGKEDSVPIPGSPYSILFSIPEPGAGSDRYSSYMTENVALRFKLLKEKEVVLTGSAPGGGEFVNGGYRLAFPAIRRLVVTDYIADYGVLFIWSSALFFTAGGGIWLLIRVFFPRREMLFMHGLESTRGYSRSEGGARRHAGVFHEALDLIDSRQKVVEPAKTIVDPGFRTIV